MRSVRRMALATLVMASLMVSALLAQDRTSVGLFGGVGIPTGPFGDELSEEAGLARTGFMLGADLVVPIHPVPGLGWASIVEGASFGIDDDFVEWLTGGVASELSFDIGRYWAAFAFTGLQYSLPVIPDLDVYGLGQIGAGMLKAPGASIVYLGMDYDLETFWEPLKGVSAGLGATVKDRFTLDVRYFHFINPEVRGELRYLSEVEEIEADQPVSWFQVMAGYRLF
jgi:hypothetical protein